MAELRQSGLRPDYKLNTTALSITYRNVGELKLDPRNRASTRKNTLGRLPLARQWGIGFSGRSMNLSACSG
jgi:hypothetical protein